MDWINEPMKTPYGLPDATIRQLWSGRKGGPDALMQFVTAEGPIPPGWEARIRANDFEALRGVGHTYGLVRSDLVLPHVTAFLDKVDSPTA